MQDLQTKLRSPLLSYAYWHLHLRPILLRFPRRTRACNSFPLSDRVLGLSQAVSALIYRSVLRDGIRKREILTATLQIMPRAMRVVVVAIVATPQSPLASPVIIK